MQAALAERGILHLWHFTDTANIPSIRASGLLSWANLCNQRMVPLAPGGNDWSHDADRLSGVDSYVHLAFKKEHPMLFRAQQDGRIRNVTWIKICSSALKIPNTRFTTAVANQAGVQLLDNETAKASIDFIGLYSYLDFSVEENKVRKNAAKKSQILVPNMVPLNFILGYDNG
jgi:hypothetical protein